MIKILGIKIFDRIKESGFTQEILTRYSPFITTRLGFHEVTDNLCSREAYIVLHIKDKDSESEKMREELELLGGIQIREMVFEPGHADNNAEQQEGSLDILGILVEKNLEVIQSVQKILSSYGCYIRTRLGVNETFFGEPAGLIILELTGDHEQRLLLEKDLDALPGAYVRKMVF